MEKTQPAKWVVEWLAGLTDEKRAEVFATVELIGDPLSQELLRKAAE